MKVFIDKENSDYIEIKKDLTGSIDLSIRTKKDPKSSIIVTAKLNKDTIDKIIANLILLKSKVNYDEEQ